MAAEVSGVFSGDLRTEDQTLPSESLPDLEAAVRADLAAGDLGRRWLLEDGEYLDGCYFDAYLYLTYRLADREGSNSMEVTDAPAGAAVPYTEASGSDYATVTIALQPGASRTLALLEELAGIGPDQELALAHPAPGLSPRPGPDRLTPAVPYTARRPARAAGRVTAEKRQSHFFQ